MSKKKRDEVRPINPVARALRSPVARQRVVRSGKVYRRKGRGGSRMFDEKIRAPEINRADRAVPPVGVLEGASA